MRSAIVLASIVAMLTLSGILAADQSVALASAQASQLDPTASEALLTAQAQGGEIAQPPLQPRSMRPYWHVFMAFAVVWLLLFGYALTVGRRFGRLEEEVRRLRSTP
jgi:CcmD family protein